MRRRRWFHGGVGAASELFEDPHTDARVRGLIPRFAILCSAAYVVVAGAASRTAGELLGLGVLLALTLALTWAVARRNLLARVSRRAVFVLLVVYAALIAYPTTTSGAVLLLDEIILVLAVLFGAVFFAGWARLAAPVTIALVGHLMLALAGKGSWGELGAHLVGYVVVGFFGSELADVLRESLRANQAIHAVLEATGGDLGDADIARIGVAAALSVSGWDAGVVMLVDGEILYAAAVAGLPEMSYSLRVDGPGLSAAVVRSGAPQYAGDVGELLGGEQALIGWGAACMAGVPIRYHGEVIGALALCHRTRRPFADADRYRVTQVAEQLGLALGNARAYRQEAAVAARLLDLNQRKDEFLANVSHELRTPATSIGLAARTLHSGRGRLNAEQQDRIVEMMRRRSAELSGLIEALLAETVAESGQTRLEIQPVDWVEALPRWVAASSDVTGRPVEMDLPEGPVVTFSDPAKCERIVGNLLSNAAKFSAPDTPVTCRLVATVDAVEVVVVDRGVGIPAHVLPHVFDRFYQGDGSTTRAHGGLGIGMSLVRHFAEAHGGSVDVASAVGVGTTVTVRLPRNAGGPDRLSVVPPLTA